MIQLLRLITVSSSPNKAILKIHYAWIVIGSAIFSIACIFFFIICLYMGNIMIYVPPEYFLNLRNVVLCLKTLYRLFNGLLCSLLALTLKLSQACCNTWGRSGNSFSVLSHCCWKYTNKVSVLVWLQLLTRFLLLGYSFVFKGV